MNSSRGHKRKLVSDDDEQNENSKRAEEDSDDEGGVRIDGIYIPPPPKAACTVLTNGRRLVITRIGNYFFKSYAEEQLLGPFHKCFNAIVGPNGSGKSNVIDAMLFVFGYRASKIRSRKISVLLHNSEHYRNVQSCTVTVHFAEIIDKEGEDYEIVDGSEFTISRTANKDNSSYYEINNKRVQFKEVAKRLRMFGVDLDHNRFLILQGEVEQISMMKPKAQNENETGMLEYLEDIIGTSRFKVPLVQLDERIEILSEKQNEKISRVKLVEKELSELKKPMEQAVEFLNMENRITLNKNVLFQWQILQLTTKITEVEEEKVEVVSVQKELLDKLTALETEKSSKEDILQEAARKHETLEKRKEKIQEAFNVANNRHIKLQEEMTQLNKSRKKIKEYLAEEQRKLSNLQKVPEENQKSIIECTSQEEKLAKKKETLEAEKTKLLASLRSETQELQDQKETLQTELIDLSKKVDETKSAYTLAESELKIYVSTEENEKKKLETVQNRYQEVKEIVVKRAQEITELKKKIPLTEKSLSEAQKDLNTVKVKESKLIDDVRKRRMSLAETKSSMQAFKSRNKVLNALMQQKREGNCNGLFGRLGDLGAIDQEYDVAISTACGPLDNIVVDTVATAQWCIEFLKKYDIGRATFIALEKQEHLRQRANTSIRTPENVSRLFDLIRIQDERVKPAFYYALRDTLVANDLGQASRIAYGAQRYRVVTLAGQLIEMTGTMSGGGKTVCRGRMGQSVAVSTSEPKDVEKMERKLEDIEEEVRQLRQKQNSYENQIRTLEPELKQMKVNLEKFSIELQSAKQEEPLLAKQLQAQKVKSQSVRADPATVKRLTQLVSNKKDVYEEASSIAEEKQDEVNRITAKIKEKTTGKMKTLEKTLKEVTQNIDKLKAEITRLQVGIKTAERNTKRSTEKIATLEQDLVNAENGLQKMKSQRDEIETDAQQLITTIEHISAELTESEEGYGEIKQEVAVITKKENKIKSDKIEVDQKCKVYDKKIGEYKGEIYQWKTKLENLKLQQIPDQPANQIKTFSGEDLQEMDIKNVQRQLVCDEEKIKIAKPNLNAINEYRRKQDVYIQRTTELDEILNQKAKVKEALEDVKLRRKREFFAGFSVIRLKVKEMYQMITLEGDADFELVDAFDPFNEGVLFNVRPPKKSWKNISNLSGGEKTLSSLALVFALHYYKPSPLYVMDEIDAALDFKNVSIVGNYIKERTKNAQFIIISLRSNMFELCDHLIGIYKTFNCTKSVCIDPRQPETANDRNKSQNDLLPNNDENNKTTPDQENTVQNGDIFTENSQNTPEKLIDEESTSNLLDSDKSNSETEAQFDNASRSDSFVANSTVVDNTECEEVQNCSQTSNWSNSVIDDTDENMEV